MKTIYYSFVLTILSFGFVSCEIDSVNNNENEEVIQHNNETISGENGEAGVAAIDKDEAEAIGTRD